MWSDSRDKTNLIYFRGNPFSKLKVGPTFVILDPRPHFCLRCFCLAFIKELYHSMIVFSFEMVFSEVLRCILSNLRKVLLDSILFQLREIFHEAVLIEVIHRSLTLCCLFLHDDYPCSTRDVYLVGFILYLLSFGRRVLISYVNDANPWSVRRTRGPRDRSLSIIARE